MLYLRLEELQEYLPALFIDDLELPTEFDIKLMIYSCVVNKNKPITTIKMLTDFIKIIEDNEAVILEASEDPFDTYLPEELIKVSNDIVSCFQFFQMLLDEDYLPSVEDSHLIVHRICYIVRHVDVMKSRVEEVIQLLKKTRSICDDIGTDFLNSIPCLYTHIDKPCDCYQYQMSGDCHHIDDLQENGDE